MTFQTLQRLMTASILAFAVVACGGSSGSTSKSAPASITDISIIAGALGGAGYANGTGTAARFSYITDLAYETNGNILVLDSDKIRRVTSAGVVSDVRDTGLAYSLTAGTGGSVIYSALTDPVGITISRLSNNGLRTVLAGGGLGSGYVDGLGTAVALYSAIGLTLASDGTLYFIDNSTVRKLSPLGQITTIAGRSNETGNTDGIGSAATFNSPQGLALSNDGILLYVSDSDNHRIRVINLSTKAVSHFAGSTSGPVIHNANGTLLGACGEGGSSLSTAQFCRPMSIRMTPAGTLVVADFFNARIRAINATGQVSTLIGSTPGPASGGIFAGYTDGPAASTWVFPNTLAVSSDGLSVAIGNQDEPMVRVLKAGNLSSLAGSRPQDGTADGTGINARFNGRFTAFTVLPDGTMVAAQEDRKFRRISATGNVSSDLGTTPRVNTMASNNLGDVYYTSDEHLFKLSSTGVSTTIATVFTATTSGFITPTDTPTFSGPPVAMVATTDGTVYFADNAGYRIRKVTPAGVVTTLVSEASLYSANDMGINPFVKQTMMLDSRGDILIGNPFNIRKITPAGVVTAVSDTVGCYGAATIDAANNLYCSQGSNTITRISPAGVETVLVAAPSDGSVLFRTGNTNASINTINHLKLLSETAISLVFAVASDNERVIVKATVAK
jgi:sugar lactone lactonase YvrE